MRPLAPISNTARALLGIAFFVLTVPISSHLLAKAAHGAGYRLWEQTVCDELEVVLAEPGEVGARETNLPKSNPA